MLDEDEDGVLRPTLAGLLALGFYPQKHFPRLSVSFAAYPGTTKATLPETGQRFLDSNDFVGPIPVMIAEAVAAVAKNMRTGSFFEGAFREDVPDYPQEAVREAVANALMHRDYSPEAWGAQVQVNMYADRLEILNPGGLYGSVTVDTLGTLGLSLKSKRIFVQNTRKHPIRSSTRESALCRGEQRVGICGNRNAAGGRIHGAAEAP